VVREYVGHAIGTEMHESPQVPNYWPGTPGPTLKEGMGLRHRTDGQRGTYETYMLEDGWSIMTPDGQLSAHLNTPSRSPTMARSFYDCVAVASPAVRAIELTLGEERRFRAALEIPIGQEI